MPIPTTDVTFRTNDSGNWVMASTSEHILNTVQRLLYTHPGTDVYNPDMGLDIMGRCQKAYQDNSRDTEFENRMIDQLNKYTDIIPIAVVAQYRNKLMIIDMSITYESVQYRLQMSSDPSTLESQLVRVNS